MSLFLTGYFKLLNILELHCKQIELYGYTFIKG